MEKNIEQKKPFTLIEMLVVVAIILILAAMLLPALDRAVEQGKRASCAASLHQIGIALASYGADDSKRQFPPGNATVGQGHGIDSTYVVPTKQAFGLAFLMTEGYVSNGGAAMMYCPSWRHPYLQMDVVDYGGLDPNPSFGVNDFGGWPSSGVGGPNKHRGISYHYRSTFEKNTGFYNTPPSMRMDGPSGRAIAADHWSYRYVDLGQEYGHIEGFSTVYLDGHTKWVKEGLAVAGTNLASGGNTNGAWAWQELNVWRVYFD